MLSEINQFVNWVRHRNPEARTWRDYRSDLKQFEFVIGNRSLSEITFRDIDEFISWQSDRGLQPATIKRRLSAIVSLYSFLSEYDPTLVCPVLPHRHHIRQPQRLSRPVAKEDLRKFFSVIDSPRDLAMFLLMLRCGLRISEVAKARLQDLFLNECQPRLLVRGKGSRERSAYLSPQSETALRKYLAIRQVVPSDFMFISYLGSGLSTTAIHRRIMRYRQHAGVKISAHRLRHTFANDLINASVPITTIQKLLGHRWLKSTQTYVMANDQQVKKDFYQACQKLEGWS